MLRFYRINRLAFRMAFAQGVALVLECLSAAAPIGFTNKHLISLA